MGMTQQQFAQMISLSAQNVPLKEIEAKTGINYSQVCRMRQRPEIAAKIEQEAAELINQGLTSARQTITKLAARGTAPEDQDNASVLKLALDASKTIISAAGLSGQAPSTIINNLLQINNAPDQTKELSDLASYLTSKLITVDSKSNNNVTIDVTGETMGEEEGMACSNQTHTSTAPLNSQDDRTSDGRAGNLSESEVEGDADD